jgi:hypothetical protein
MMLQTFKLQLNTKIDYTITNVDVSSFLLRHSMYFDKTESMTLTQYLIKMQIQVHIISTN